MKKNSIPLSLNLLALILTFIPYGVRMRWMAPPPEEYRITWQAYFSMLPFGYGDIFPLITSLLTAALLILQIIVLIVGEGGCLIRSVSFMASAASLLALGMQVFLLGYLSPIGAGIAVLLIFITILYFRNNKEQNNG